MYTHLPIVEDLIDRLAKCVEVVIEVVGGLFCDLHELVFHLEK